MDYQKLFNHMNEEFGLVLLQTEMDTIVNVVNEIQTEELCQSCVRGSSLGEELLKQHKIRFELEDGAELPGWAVRKIERWQDDR
jgi:hypothetical protein